MTLKTSVFIAASLDGFIARENGDLDWLTGQPSGDPDEDYGYSSFIDTVDVLVMGRHTYEKVRSFDIWPYQDLHVVVLSTQKPEVPDELKKNVEVRNLSPRDVVKKLSDEGFQHAYIDGGRTLSQFLNAGLLDELIITRIPVLIGNGIPLFEKIDQDIHLVHEESASFDNGFVQSRYRIKSAAG